MVEEANVNSRSEQDKALENMISLIGGSVDVIYELRKIIQDHPPQLTRVILKSLEVSLLWVTREWEQLDVGKLEAKIKKLRERDQELSAIICHMADQLIGRVPIKPVESEKAKDALIADLQRTLNKTRDDLKEQLREATNTIDKIIMDRDDLLDANIKLTAASTDLRNRAVPNSDLIKANAKLHKENAVLKDKIKALEDRVEMLDHNNSLLVEEKRKWAVEKLELNNEISRFHESGIKDQQSTHAMSYVHEEMSKENEALRKINKRLELDLYDKDVELGKIAQYKDSLISGVCSAFEGVLSPETIEGCFDKIINNDPEVRNVVNRLNDLRVFSDNTSQDQKEDEES